MKKQAAVSRKSSPFVQRVNGEISPKQYVRTLDQRLAARRRSEEQQARRKKK